MILSQRPGLWFASIVAWPVAASAQVPVQVTTPAPVFTGTVLQTGPATKSVTTASTPTSTIGSHQIDRFEAIRQVQADLNSDANNLANWAILGELAHEVALDIPQGQDDAYYKLSREAYERASQLDPNNVGLKSAVQFAREQEANSVAFDARRRQGVATYLESRRREMAATGVNPTLMVYESASAPVTTTNEGQPTVVNQPSATAYPTPTYRPYYNPQAQQPYSYNQYSNGYVPPVNNANGNQQTPPTTLRQLGQQLPGVLLNQGVRSFSQPSGVPPR